MCLDVVRSSSVFFLEGIVDHLYSKISGLLSSSCLVFEDLVYLLGLPLLFMAQMMADFLFPSTESLTLFVADRVGLGV